MRCASGLMVMMLIPGSAFAQDTSSAGAIDPPAPPAPPAPEGAPDAATFDLADLPEAPAPNPVRGDCTAPETLPGDDPVIVVCGQRARDYASISQNYDKGGWAKPPLPGPDPRTLSASCMQASCLPPASVDYVQVVIGLVKIGKKIIDGE